MEDVREVGKSPKTPKGNERSKSPTPTPSINKISAPEFSVSELKRQSSYAGSGSGRPRFNCLCSPTTHAGSFRCRHHRGGLGMTRGGSVGSNLSLLAAKSGTISDSLQAQ